MLNDVGEQWVHFSSCFTTNCSYQIYQRNQLLFDQLTSVMMNILLGNKVMVLLFAVATFMHSSLITMGLITKKLIQNHKKKDLITQIL